jgi:4-hydroxythreonine-4-phosphate dehydrogenase
MPKKIKIGYTIGDLAGIGYEIFQKIETIYRDDRRIEVILVDDLKAVAEFMPNIIPGRSGSAAGRHAIATLKKANQMALAGEIDYLITGPVSKESLHMAGDNSSGQTELLAKINGLNREQIEMFFVLDEFRVVLATRHIPLSKVPETLVKRLAHVLENSCAALKQIWQISEPRLAISGLNPHAGENGLLGKEEIEMMIPIINKFKKVHPEVKITGPSSADYIFSDSARRYLKHDDLAYDLHIACYHDQILPLIKGIGGYKSINLTAGLPYIRISVDHGTGFDIAGKNLASPKSLESCTEFCIKLSENTRQVFID